MIELFSMLGIFDVCRKMWGGKIRFVLCFHGIRKHQYQDISTRYKPTLSQADLDIIINWLKKKFRILTPNEFLNTDLPGVLLTFDDGLKSDYVNGLSVLEKYSAPAIFFISTQHISDPNDWLPSYKKLAEEGWGSIKEVPTEIAMDFFDGMSDDEVRSCAKHPLITVGSHSISHPFLTKSEPDDLKREIFGSKQLLEEITGEPITLFAYPAGDYNKSVLEEVKLAGYKAAFAVDRLRIDSIQYEIPRIGIYSSGSSYLNAKLSGLYRKPQRLKAMLSE